MTDTSVTKKTFDLTTCTELLRKQFQIVLDFIDLFNQPFPLDSRGKPVFSLDHSMYRDIDSIGHCTDPGPMFGRVPTIPVFIITSYYGTFNNITSPVGTLKLRDGSACSVEHAGVISGQALAQKRLIDYFRSIDGFSFRKITPDYSYGPGHGCYHGVPCDGCYILGPSYIVQELPIPACTDIKMDTDHEDFIRLVQPSIDFLNSITTDVRHFKNSIIVPDGIDPSYAIDNFFIYNVLNDGVDAGTFTSDQASKYYQYRPIITPDDCPERLMYMSKWDHFKTRMF